MVVVADTSSLLTLVRHLLPFDRDGIILPTFEREVRSDGLLITDKVLVECREISSGEVVKAIGFLGDKRFKAYDTSTLPMDRRLFDFVDNGFAVKAKVKKLSEDERASQRERFINGADFSILRCAYASKWEARHQLFGGEVAVMTEETMAQNDGKCYKKIPLCCRAMNMDIKVFGIVDYVRHITGGKLHFEL